MNRPSTHQLPGMITEILRGRNQISLSTVESEIRDAGNTISKKVLRPVALKMEKQGAISIARRQHGGHESWLLKLEDEAKAAGLKVKPKLTPPHSKAKPAAQDPPAAVEAQESQEGLSGYLSGFLPIGTGELPESTRRLIYTGIAVLGVALGRFDVSGLGRIRAFVDEHLMK